MLEKSENPNNPPQSIGTYSKTGVHGQWAPLLAYTKIAGNGDHTHDTPVFLWAPLLAYSKIAGNGDHTHDTPVFLCPSPDRPYVQQKPMEPVAPG